MASLGRLDFFSSFDSICRLLSEDIFAGFEMRHAGVEGSTPGAPRASAFLSKSPQIRLPTHNLDPMGLGQMRLLAMGTGRRDSETAGFTIRFTVPKRRSLTRLP